MQFEEERERSFAKVQIIHGVTSCPQMGVGRAKKTDAPRCTNEFELGWPKYYRVSFGFDYWLRLSPDEGGE